jgi:aerobic carbon-monoxide dehydrogenase medium subunit
MKLPIFDYACPETVTEAVALLAAHDGEAKVIAGGQSLVPMLAFRVASPSLLVDLRKLGDLRQITIDDDGITLGAMVRWRDILDDKRLAQAHPLLAAAVGHIGHYQIRNRGTVGGSLAHADPAAELPCIAVTCDAKIVAVGRSGRRVFEAAEFFHGALMTALQPDEIIIEMHFPIWPRRRRFGFREFARRRGDFALVAAAVGFEAVDGKAGQSFAQTFAQTFAHVRIGAIGVADRPIRLAAAERALEGRDIAEDAIVAAATAASAAVAPTGDIHASGDYRKTLIGVMVERALRDAVAGRIL